MWGGLADQRCLNGKGHACDTSQARRRAEARWRHSGTKTLGQQRAKGPSARSKTPKRVTTASSDLMLNAVIDFDKATSARPSRSEARWHARPTTHQRTGPSRHRSGPNRATSERSHSASRRPARTYCHGRASSTRGMVINLTRRDDGARSLGLMT
jgi:hypothetical protein